MKVPIGTRRLISRTGRIIAIGKADAYYDVRNEWDLIGRTGRLIQIDLDYGRGWYAGKFILDAPVNGHYEWSFFKVRLARLTNALDVCLPVDSE